MTEDKITCFWRYLEATGVIDAERAAECQEDARLRWMPLGRVLLGRGLLDIGELTELLEASTSRPDARLGDLAVERGLCSRSDITEALMQQRETAEHPLLALVRDESVDGDALIGSIYDYVRFLEGRVRVFEGLEAERA